MKEAQWFTATVFLLACESVLAMPFGVFDPRSLAMGGTGVASANANNAVYHNPALMAQYQYDEDQGRQSIVVLPSITARASNTVEEIAQFREEDYDGQLSRAINAFNANGDSTAAQAVLDASLNLQSGLSRIADGPIFADGNIGFVIAIPSDKQGGAFLFNRRFVGDGRIYKTAEDEALLNAYVATMQYLVTGQNPPPQEVVNLVLDQNNELIDQTGNLTSSAVGTGAMLTELGLSMGGEFTVFKRRLALGITPKAVKAELYSTDASATNDFDESETDAGWDVTADVGVAKFFDNGWNAGLSIKNIIPLLYSLPGGNEISINPQVRAGVAYRTGWGMLSLDADLLENESLGDGDDTQYGMLGTEWDIKWGKLRGGYSYNFSASSPVDKGMFSVGIQLSPLGILLDIAYADNGVERAGALQTGFKF